MKTLNHIARILLGLLFAVSGANGFLHFIPLPPPPEGPAEQFTSALFTSGYFVPVFGLQLIGGSLLLVNRLVPVALALLAPIVVNIVLYHVLMAPPGTAMAMGTLVLLAWLFYRERAAFAGIPWQGIASLMGRPPPVPHARTSADCDARLLPVAVRGRRGTLLAKDRHELL